MSDTYNTNAHIYARVPITDRTYRLVGEAPLDCYTEAIGGYIRSYGGEVVLDLVKGVMRVSYESGPGGSGKWNWDQLIELLECMPDHHITCWSSPPPRRREYHSGS